MSFAISVFTVGVQRCDLSSDGLVSFAMCGPNGDKNREGQ